MKKIFWYAFLVVILAIAIFLGRGQTIPSSTLSIKQYSQENPALRVAQANDILTANHTVLHQTTVPGFEGQTFQLYVHERVKKNIANAKVVLFIHGYSGSGVPSFDLNYKDYSWMAYLAEQGFDAFSIDLTGDGSSTRPAPMNDSCNIEKKYQVSLKLKQCNPTYPSRMTTIQSDWDDIDAVVDYLRQLRKVDRISLIGSSWGGVRSLGYASIHPEKIDKLIVQGTKGMASLTDIPEWFMPNLPLKLSTSNSLNSLWKSMQKCQDQVEPTVFDTVWKSMLVSDPLGATWGGVVRFPTFTLAGADRQDIKSLKAPILLIGGQYDWLASPGSIRKFYRSLEIPKKVQMTINCTSHFIAFERRNQIMYKASSDWLQNEAISGKSQGWLTVKADGVFNWQ